MSKKKDRREGKKKNRKTKWRHKCWNSEIRNEEMEKKENDDRSIKKKMTCLVAVMVVSISPEQISINRG